MERSAVSASKGERRWSCLTGILLSLKLHIHFYTVPGHKQPFPFSVLLTFWLGLSTGTARTCTGLKGQEGREWREDKEEEATRCLTTEERDGKSSFRVRRLEATEAQLHTTAVLPCLSCPFSQNTCSVMHFRGHIICKPEHPNVLIPPSPSCSSTKHTHSAESGACKGKDEDTCSCPNTSQRSKRY